MKNKSFLLAIPILIITISSRAQVSGNFIDSRDGKEYKTVTIGTQTWMAENLAYKTNNGCWVYNDDEQNVTTYGYLYNWETAKNSCPADWHLPSDAEWSKLIAYLGVDSTAGNKLKESGETHWGELNTGNNETGFTALPGGIFEDDTYYLMEENGFWWSSTENTTMEGAYLRALVFDNGLVIRWSASKNSGFSVRCLKD